VNDWIKKFKNFNPERAGSPKDAITRMKHFFSENPEYRKDDIYAATDLYLKTIAATMDKKFCMKSHKFIYDGAGMMKKSTLLEYCEKVKEKSTLQINDVKGRIFN
jgi:hypothetical protein